MFKISQHEKCAIRGIIINTCSILSLQVCGSVEGKKEGNKI